MQINLFSGWCGWLNCLLATAALGQSAPNRSVPQSYVEAGTLLSSGQTPFWLRANQYGAVPLRNPALRLAAGLTADYRPADSTGKRPAFDWGYGADFVANAGATNQVLLVEGYAKARWGPFELYGGRRRERFGLTDTLLTSGSYGWSGNALPIPKLQLSLPTYTPVPFTSGIVSVMGTFAHGWFVDADRLSRGNLLHQKSAYGRLGKPTWPFRLYGGFNHQVVWAGFTDPKLLGDAAPAVTVDGRHPSGWRYFPSVVTGSQIRISTNSQFSSFDDNRVGNHLGSIDLAADVTIRDWNVFLYRQFVYDDGSLFYGTNLVDGLYGLRLKNRQKPADETPFFLQQITLEHLYTVSQGGNQFDLFVGQLRGRDDYFNNAQFIDGWTYRRQTIGSPFLTPAGETRPTLPQRYGVVNNRVSLVHLGISGVVMNQISVTSRLSFSNNLGTYSASYAPSPQFLGLFAAELPVGWLGGCVLNGAIAIDAGRLLPTSVGTYISLRKSGLLTPTQSPDQKNPFKRF